MGGSQLNTLPREERRNVKGHYSPLSRRWRQQQQQWKQQLRLLQQFLVGDAELLLRPAAGPTAAATRGKRRLVRKPPRFSRMSCSSSAIPTTTISSPSPSSPSTSEERTQCIHVLHSGFDLQRLTRAKSVYFIITIIGVCSVTFFAVSNLSICSSSPNHSPILAGGEAETTFPLHLKA